MKTLSNHLQDALPPVGWFSCRSNSQFRPSLRETTLHSQLALEFGQKNTNNFVFVLVENFFKNKNIREFHSKFYQMDSNPNSWTLLSGTILNWNRNTDENTYRSLPTLGFDLINNFTKENKRPDGLVEGVLKRGHHFVAESLHKITKLSAEISRVEADISKLQKGNEKDRCCSEEDKISGSHITGTPSPTRRGTHFTDANAKGKK